jgi:competence protein ComEC
MRLFATAFVLGTLALQQRSALPDLSFALLGIAALLAARLTRGRRWPEVALLITAGAAIGFGYAAWRAELRLAEALPAALEGQDVAVTGVIAGLPQVSEKGTRFLFHVEDAAQAAIPRVVSLGWYAERARGVAAFVPAPRLAAGERWTFTVRLKRPRGLANPHTFDFEAWALERGIRATGYVRAKEAHARIADRVEGWPYTLHRWRGEIRERMRASLAQQRLRGVLIALAIGDQDAIAAEDWEVFWRTGVGHLMSISGLHITMLAGAGFALVFFAWVRVPGLALRFPARKAAIVAGMLVALGYSLMTGYAVPAQRTFVMLAVIALCVLLDRYGSASRVLALAALAVLAIDPWAVLSPGFWLSFGAVAAIFYVMALRTGLRGRIGTAIAEQIAVTVVMLPMLLALFQQISLVSPFANAVAIPVVSFAVVPLTLGGAFLDLPSLLGAAHVLMLALMSSLERLAELPFAMLEGHAPRPWTIAAGVAGCAWLLAPRGLPLRSCGALWLIPMFAIAPSRPAPGEAWLDVLDVGNGLAIVVRTAAHALAYDAGPTWNPDADSGNRIVVPYLRGEGIARLDGLVISHADDDHSGGAASVAESRAPSWLLSPLAADDALHAMVIRSSRCASGQGWHWDGVDFRVLHPASAAYEERGGRKENDRSCVLRVASAGATALLTGDVEARGEGEMRVRDASALRADLLIVPHHGSKTSSTPGFLDAVGMRIGVLSVGHRNRFRHPNEAVIARYLERNVELRRTDVEGALRVVLPASSEAPIAITGQDAACRYWTERPCAQPAGSLRPTGIR